ncbi:MAG: methyltransferase domain-containing protein [Dehalococcoidia bacterium]
MTSVWNPEQYEKFRDERSAPFFDLMALVQPVPGGRVVDLGCGTGELTRALHEYTGAAETVGVDNSETMLAKSEAFAGNGLRFELGEVENWASDRSGEGFDLLFSNAALQWVNGHAELFPRLMRAVAPGGQVAVQMPANNDHPSHMTAHRVAGQEPFRTYLGGYVRSWPVMPPEWYAELLDREGFAEQSVRLQVYGHRLASREGVVEWVRGTLLTDCEKRMRPEQYAEFLEAYRAELMPLLEEREPYFYAFKRVLLWGRR